MSEIELRELKAKAARVADEQTGETEPTKAKSSEWFGFYYGYIKAMQEKQANGAETRSEKCTLPVVNNSALKSGTGTYMVVATLLTILAGACMWKIFGNIDAALAIGIIINTMLCAAVRFNQ